MQIFLTIYAADILFSSQSATVWHPKTGNRKIHYTALPDENGTLTTKISVPILNRDKSVTRSEKKEILLLGPFLHRHARAAKLWEVKPPTLMPGSFAVL